MSLPPATNASSSSPTQKKGNPEVVIDVSDVAIADKPLNDIPYKEAVEALLSSSPRQRGDTPKQATRDAVLEACSRYSGQLVAPSGINPVLHAAHLAFTGHRPLVLTPDTMWLLVAQGFAAHVRANAEKLRPLLVKHQGRLPLEIRRDDFIKGSPENPWPELFQAFSAQIRDHIGSETHDALTPRFSTTGPIERAAADIVLLDAMQSYFKYIFVSLCGIPQIVLQGKVDDWESLRQRTRGLAKYDLTWWISGLDVILDAIVDSSKGNANRQFWQSIYRFRSRSGADVLTGWLAAFFPYVKDGQRNPAISRIAETVQSLLSNDSSDPNKLLRPWPEAADFLGGVARAPFDWSYWDKTFEMEFIGGFLGVRQDRQTLRLTPEIGWAVREVTRQS